MSLFKPTTSLFYRIVAALLVAGLVLTACTTPAETTAEPTEAVTEEVEPTEEAAETEEPAMTEEATEAATEEEMQVSGELQIMAFSGETGDDVALARVAYFREQQPDVELSFIEGGFDEQQFLTAVASGSPPDLVLIGRNQLSTYAARGALMPLTECIDSHNIDMSQYLEEAVAQVTVDGVVYGIPEFNQVIVVYADGDVLAEAGLTEEDLDTSDWDHIREINEMMTVVEDGDVTRIGFDPKLPEFLPLWAKANGVELISEDGRTAQLNDPAVVEALEFAVSLLEPAGGADEFFAFRDTWDFFGGDQHINDKLGAFPMESWYANVLTGAAPDTSMVFAPFRDREGNPITYGTGGGWVIPVGADNVEAACQWMKEVTSVGAWTMAAQTRADARAAEGRAFTGIYTANKAADEIIFNEIMQPSGNPVWDQAVEVLLSVQDVTFSIPANPAGAQFQTAWEEAVRRVMRGEQSAQEALDQAQEEAQEALDEAWSEAD